MTEIESQDPPTFESEHTKPAGKPGLFNGSTRHGELAPESWTGLILGG